MGSRHIKMAAACYICYISRWMIEMAVPRTLIRVTN